MDERLKVRRLPGDRVVKLYAALTDPTLVDVFSTRERAEAELLRFCRVEFGRDEVPSWCSVKEVLLDVATDVEERASTTLESPKMKFQTYDVESKTQEDPGALAQCQERVRRLKRKVK